MQWLLLWCWIRESEIGVLKRSRNQEQTFARARWKQQSTPPLPQLIMTTMIMNQGRKSIQVNHQWWLLMSPRRSGGRSRRCWTVAWESPVIDRHSLLCHVESPEREGRVSVWVWKGENEREIFCRLEGSAVCFTINMRGLLEFPFSIVNNTNVYLLIQNDLDEKVLFNLFFLLCCGVGTLDIWLIQINWPHCFKFQCLKNRQIGLSMVVTLSLDFSINRLN